MNKQVVVIEDDKDIAGLVSHYLEREGFVPLTAYDGEEGLWQIKSRSPALVILDLMLPRKSGYEVMKQLKDQKTTAGIPVIILTARSDEIDRVLGLELGADDYMTKPFSPRELIARVKAVMRRTVREAETDRSKRIVYGKLQMDDLRHEVRYDDTMIPLTSKEYSLLKYFLEHTGVVLSRDVLLQDIWGYNYFGTTRTVDVHVSRLRKKLPHLDAHIQNVKDIGYKFTDE
ncbi:MAG: response regulator transcription factor [Deltaproteobacteria bacterium]|nr:response regulator transcription factor [Deltaproteobacteria bacterium]